MSAPLPAAPPDLVFALTGDVRRNSRALKQLRTLTAIGYRITALTFGPPASGPAPVPGVRLVVLPEPSGQGPRYFWRVHRLFRAAAHVHPARAYHASDLYTLPAMASSARRHGGRLFYDARECYPHVASTAGRPGVRRFWQAVEGHYARRADAVFTVSPRIAQHMASHYGIAEPAVVYNAPPLQRVPRSRAFHERLGLPPERVVVLHQGQLRKARGGPALVTAMAQMRGADLVLLGDGPMRPLLLQQATQLGVADRVHVLPPVLPDALLPLTAAADIGVTLLEDTCLNHRYALPNKLFEYLMAGLPVLGSDLPEVREVIQRFDVGRVADPANPEALASTLQAMIDDRSARQRWSAHTLQATETFNWNSASQPFIAHYRTLLGPRIAP